MGALVADQSAGTFYDDLSGRVYLSQGPQDTDLPICIVSLVSNMPELTFANDGGEMRSSEFQVDLYGHKDSGAKAVGDINTKLFDLMHDATLTVAGFTNVGVRCLDRGSPSVEEDAIRFMSRWTVSGTAT